MSSKYLPNPMIYCYNCQGILYTNIKIIKYENLPYNFCSEECCNKWKERNCTLICKNCKNKYCFEEGGIHVNTSNESEQNICRKCSPKELSGKILFKGF